MSEDLELIEFLDQLTATYPTYEYIRTEASPNVLRKTKSAEYLVASTASVISIPSEDYNESDLYPLPPDVIKFLNSEVGPINIETGSEAKRQLTGKSRRRSSVDSLLNPFKSKKLEAEMIVFQPDNFAMVVGSSASLTKHSDDDLLEVPLPAPSSQRKSSVDTLKAFAIRKLSTSIIPLPSPGLIPQRIDNDTVADNITSESAEADKSSLTPPIPHKVRRATVDHGSISNSKRNSQKLVSFKLPTMSAFQTEPAKKIERAQTKVHRNERHPKAVSAIDDEIDSDTVPIVKTKENTASNYMVDKFPDVQALIDSLRSECSSLKEQLESQTSEFKEKELQFEEERLEMQQSIKNISQKSEEVFCIYLALKNDEKRTWSKETGISAKRR